MPALSSTRAEAIVIGAGFAGLSAALYLARACRDVLVIDSDHSMGKWEPHVDNYLGFPEGISGVDLLHRGRRQATRFGARFADDEILHAQRGEMSFILQGRKQTYQSDQLLLATGIYHLPPEIEGVRECLGKSMFFCKDCDGQRVQDKRIAIYGRRNEAVEYALGMIFYSPCVVLVLNGASPQWDEQHAAWLKEYDIPVYAPAITRVEREEGYLRSLAFADGSEVALDALFTTRGDLYFNQLAEDLGAEVDPEGQIKVDSCLRTTVKKVYAAGCVTPANCQMIIAAGLGATAGQTMNRDFFEESLQTHSLRHYRQQQLIHEQTEPEILKSPPS